MKSPVYLIIVSCILFSTVISSRTHSVILTDELPSPDTCRFQRIRSDTTPRTGVPIAIKTLKGTIDWKDNERGNITFKGSIPLGESDLSSLEDSYLDDFIRFNDTIDGNSGDFVKINGKKTTVVWKSKNDNGFRRTTKFTLRKGVLYITYKTKRGFRYARAFGITNTDTDGWVSTSSVIDFNFTVGTTAVNNRGHVGLNYRTKADKKSVFKSTSGPPAHPVSD